jgi:hypothetical protein
MNIKEQKFKKGDIVQVEKIGYNASNFNHYGSSGSCGVYEFKDWNLLLFEITGQIKLWTGVFENSINEWCYELKLYGSQEQNFRAFVYETGLKLIREEGKKDEPSKKTDLFIV